MNNTFVVAIGSSAGGLNAMKVFFDHTPHDHVTYIILRHLPIDCRSELQQILQRHSKLKILEAVDNSVIEKDTVYIPPPSKYMTISKDRLFLHQRAQQSTLPNFAVDIFLASLAKSNGKKSIAIIMSGAGSDGSKGVTSIKNAGGMVIVQKLQSCEFVSMPQNALKTGFVDFQLLPSEMPGVILQHVADNLETNDMIGDLEIAGDSINLNN